MDPRTTFGRNACLVFALCSASLLCAQYDGPESVEYDPVGDRYFVSNTGDASIKVRDQNGDVTAFASTLEEPPYGLELVDGVVYACMGSGVRGFNAVSGEMVFTVNLNATFLNGITSDGTSLFVTDFAARQIHKVAISDGSSSILVANTQGQPNGIVWDAANGRLVVVFWSANAAIRAYDPISGASSTLVASTGLGYIDGITIDCLGNFLVSSWNPARITRFEPTFTAIGVNMGIAVDQPADIDFDTVNQRICIPNAGSDEVDLVDVDCGTGIAERTITTRIMPNPTSGLVRFDPPLLTPQPYIVMDARGLLIAGGNLAPRGMLDLGRLEAGVYTIYFSKLAHQVRVVKE